MSMSAVNRRRGQLTRLMDMDNQVGGVSLAEVASRQARRLLDAVERYEMSARVENADAGPVSDQVAGVLQEQHDFAWSCYVVTTGADRVLPTSRPW